MRHTIRLIVVAGLLLVAGSAVPVLAWSPYGFRDHAAWTASQAPYGWASETLRDILSWEIMNGYDAGTVTFDGKTYQYAPAYHPERAITRAEFAAILARTLGTHAAYPAGGHAPFADTPDPALWYQPYLTTLAAQSVIRPDDYPDAILGVNQPITRGEIATWIARATRAYGITWEEPRLPFSDVPADYPFRGELAGAVALGVIRGYPDGSFRPSAFASRAECAQMVRNLIPLLGKSEPTMAELQAALQAGDDAYYGFVHATMGQSDPDYAAFVETVSPFFTLANYRLWYNPDYAERFSTTRDGKAFQGGIILGDPLGWGGGYSTLWMDLVGTRAVSPAAGYLALIYEDVTPLLVTERFAKVDSVFVFQVRSRDGHSTPQVRVRVTQYLRRDGDRWVRSGYGTETVLGVTPADSPWYPDLLDRYKN